MWFPVSCKTLNILPIVFYLKVNKLVPPAWCCCNIPQTFLLMFCVPCDNSRLCLWSSALLLNSCAFLYLIWGVTLLVLMKNKNTSEVAAVLHFVIE